jgi:hypothetical protein
VDNSQTGVLILKKYQKYFGMGTPPEKAETISFLGQDPVRCKIFVSNKCLQGNNFKYISCKIFYEN